MKLDRRHVRAAPALVVALALTAPASAAGAAADPALPATFVKMWYRTEDERAFRAKRAKGDLTVTESSIDFVGKRATMIVPFDEVAAIGLGRMHGDVDNVWAVVELRTGGLLGFRDGRKLGYGGRTDEFFGTLRAALRRAGAGPYAVPEGAQTYDALDAEFTVAIPAGWSGFNERIVESDERALWGSTLFLPLAPDTPPPRRAAAVEAARSATSASWRLVRVPAADGMRCDGFGDAGARRVAERAAEELGVDAGEVRVESAGERDGCAALRITATRDERTAEALALARHDVLYLLTFVEPATGVEDARSAFDLATRTFRIAIAH